MSDKRIIDLEAKQTLGSGDYLAADSAQGTYKVDANTNIMTPLANVRNNVANSSASPDKYSSSTAYKVGDMVIQNDILYKCTTACSAASWAVNSACFTATTLASVVTQLNSDLTNLIWQTSSEGFKYVKFPNGFIYGYKEVSLTSGGTKATGLYPNSYSSKGSYFISDIGFTKSCLAYGDVKGAYIDNLKLECAANWNNTQVTFMICTDTANAQWACRITIMGF